LSDAVLHEPSEKSPENGLWARASWLLCLVPLVAIIELVLHVKQTSDVVPEQDWAQARDAVKAEIQPEDLVVFAPFWSDPLGRRTFGDGIASMKREGRSDDDRWKRAFEVSIRGAHDEEIATHWKKIKEEKKGAVTITLYENPHYTRVIDDIVELVSPDHLTVSTISAGGGEQSCTFQRGTTAGGSTVVPQGLLTPADKFVCAGGHVGVAVLHALDHHPHLCIFATPIQSSTLRLRFSNVTFGPSLVGHSGLQWVVERTPAPDKISIGFFSSFAGADPQAPKTESLIGTHFHKVGVGWVGFELPTSDLDGKKGDLIADIGSSNQRQFCFEATTRRAPEAGH